MQTPHEIVEIIEPDQRLLIKPATTAYYIRSRVKHLNSADKAASNSHLHDTASQHVPKDISPGRTMYQHCWIEFNRLTELSRLLGHVQDP